MQKWPYADIGYLNVEHFRSTPKKNDPAQKWEYLTVEASVSLLGAFKIFLYFPIFDERDIRKGLGSCGGHRTMIPL